MKIIKLKLNRILKYWNYLNFLRINGILIFCQNLSLNAIKDLSLYLTLNDQHYKFKNLNKSIMKKFINKKFIMKIKNFNNILIINNIDHLKNIEQFLIKNDILILGYYIQKIFFFKKDFNIKKKEKINILNKLNDRVIKFLTLNKKLIINIKWFMKKFILLLKSKIK